MSDINITHDDFFKMRDTIKHHVGFMAKQALEIKKQADVIDMLRAKVESFEILMDENNKLTATIKEYKDDYKRIIEDSNPSDEQHCPCVPALRKEITKLREALKEIAKGKMGYCICNEFAQEALDDK